MLALSFNNRTLRSPHCCLSTGRASTLGSQCLLSSDAIYYGNKLEPFKVLQLVSFILANHHNQAHHLPHNWQQSNHPGSLLDSGRSGGEGIDFPFQYSWASLVAQMVKDLPAMRETWVRSLGWEDPMGEGTATHSSILAWRIMDRGAWRAT